MRIAHVILLAALSLPLHVPAAAAQAENKIGFVNTERILREAAPAVRAQKKIEAEFSKRDQEMARLADQLKRMQDELEKQGVTLAESQRRTKEREFGELNRDFQRRQPGHKPEGRPAIRHSRDRNRLAGGPQAGRPRRGLRWHTALRASRDRAGSPGRGKTRPLPDPLR